MTRIEKLIERVEALEADLAHRSEIIFHATGSAITVRIVLAGLFATLPDDVFETFVAHATGAAEREKEGGLAMMRKFGADAQDTADYLKLHDSVARDLQGHIERERARRKGA